MSDRDKLFELTKEAFVAFEAECVKHFDCVECPLFEFANVGLCKVAFIADHLLANGVTVGKDADVPTKWIPVGERLPEEREDWGFTSSALVIVAGKRHDGSLYVSQDTTTNGEWNTTHPLYWMPLPEPPKGVQG